MNAEFSNYDRIIQGERRVPDLHLTDKEAEMAWFGCVMSKLVCEMDFEENLYYSLNPESFEYHTPEPIVPYTRKARSPLQGEFILTRQWDNKVFNLR